MSTGRRALKNYEAVYIFDSALDDEKINTKLERYHALLTEGSGGEISAMDHWGRRPLAYSVEDRDNGYYVVAHFNTDPTALPEYERILRLDEDLLRYLIVINEGYLTTTPVAPAPERDEDDDDDDDGEEE
jgi:small subunit ribosomal protein S6